MAGQKGRSGGARPGAGRPPQEPAVTGERDPMKFLEDVMSGVIEANVTQVKAAIAMLPFKYQKLGEGGKKEQKNDAAKKVANRFAPAAPPQLKAVK